MAAGEAAHRAPATITSQSAKNHFLGRGRAVRARHRARRPGRPGRQRPAAVSSRSLERRDRRGEGREWLLSGARLVTGGRAGALSIIVVAAMMTKLMPKIGQRIPLITGPVLITGALAWLSTVAASTSYLTGLLGPMLLYGIGTGMIFMPLTMIGVSDVAVSDTGAASGLLDTTQQMGGALGLSILETVFGAATSGVTGGRASVLATGASTGFRSCPVKTSTPGPLPPQAASPRQHRRPAARRP